MGTKAYAQFKKTIQRSEGLLNFYIRNKNMKGISFPKDIIRGAVVLSVAAFDAYVTNVFVEKMVPYIKNNKINKELLNLLERAGVTTETALGFLKEDKPYRKMQLLVEKYYLKQVTQNLKTVNKLFRAYEIDDIVGKAAAMTKGKRTVHSIEVLIEKRHQIAHNGDYSSTGKLLDLDEVMIKKRIKTLELFVGSLDKIIGAIIV